MSGEIFFPISTAPGVNSMESGGRLINAYAEKAPPGARGKFVHRRVPGLLSRFTTAANHRGALLVGSSLYTIEGDGGFIVTKSAAGVYTATAMTGTAIAGSGRVFIDRNMNSTPQVLLLNDSGMSQINTSTGVVSDFSDADLPSCNSLCFVGGYFFLTVADGRCFASGLNAVTFGANDFARAESSPDGLVRGIRYGRDLALGGTQTIEFWSNTGNPVGFPFSFSSTIPIGFLTPHAVAGFELGWPGPPVFVASDRTVHVFAGYSTEKISTPDLDNLLAEVDDVTDLEMSVHVAKGHRFATLTYDPDTGAGWTWEFTFPDKDTPGGWHERESYGEDRWRVHMTANAFNEWFGFDRDSSSVFLIDPATKKEGDDPLVKELRSTQIHAFPSRLELNRIALDYLVGVGRDAGQDPIETDPKVLISWSFDGGRTFGNELERRLGSQGEMVTVEVNRLGTSGPRGAQIRLRISDPVEAVLMGGAWDGQVVG
jgi:hypothetical protein